MISDYVKIAFLSLKNRKLRSWLTIIGIVIGVAAIISLITISSGLKNAVEEQFSKMGSSRLFILPKTAGGGTPGMTGSLTEDDYDTVRRLSYFEFVTPYVSSVSRIEYKREKGDAYVMGVPTDDQQKRFEDFDIGLAEGRFMKPTDKKVAILGWRAAKKMFSSEIKLKSKIIIKGESYEVIGVFEERGSKQEDEHVYLPIDEAQTLFNMQGKVSMMEAKMKAGQDPNAVALRVENVLKRERNDELFEVETSDQLLQQLNAILGVIQTVLVGIASISLVVGAVGIMNSMFTSVLERRKEIGIMKSVGAQNKDIMYIFIAEAAITGLVGGLLGISLGIGMAYAVQAVGKQAGFPLAIRIELWLVFASMLFAMVVGMVSGLLPARQATKMNVVDALRQN